MVTVPAVPPNTAVDVELNVVGVPAPVLSFQFFAVPLSQVPVPPRPVALPLVSQYVNSRSQYCRL